MLETCVLTVASPTTRRAAISWFDRPRPDQDQDLALPVGQRLDPAGIAIAGPPVREGADHPRRHAR